MSTIIGNLDSLDSLNNFLFGGTSTENEDAIYSEISDLRARIQELVTKLCELPNMRNQVLRGQNIQAIMHKWPYMTLQQDTPGYSIRFNNHPLNYLYGNIQAEPGIENGSIIYQTMPFYSLRIHMDTGRRVALSNTSGNSAFRDAISTMTQIVRREIRAHTALEDALKNVAQSPAMRMAQTSGYSVCHPHAQGSMTQFTSICYGNNSWADDLQRTNSGEDFVTLLDRMAIWATSTNILDLYGNCSSERLVWDTTVPPERTRVHAEHAEALLRSAIEHLYVPCLALLPELESITSRSEFLVELEEHAIDIVSDYLGSDDYAHLYDPEYILSSFVRNPSDPTIEPPFWSVLLNKALLYRSSDMHNHQLGVQRGYPFTHALISVIKRTYALWLFHNLRYVPRMPNCLETAIRMDAFNLPAGSELTFADFVIALRAPAGLYSVYKYYNRDSTALPEFLTLCK